MEIEIFVGIIVGIILFLYGLEHLSAEVQMVAREKIKRVVEKAAKNRWVGAFVGAIATATIQSSTAFTSIVISFVDSSLLTFRQAVPLIIGANVGTTITAQLVALNMEELGPLLIILGFAIALIKKYRIIGKSIFYLGFILFALTLIATATEPLKNDTVFRQGWTDNILSGLLAGIVMTIIMQSSSVTTGLAVILAESGVIGIPVAVAAVLGANIGTTFTAAIISTQVDEYGKRAAYSHILYNVIGVVVVLFVFNQFVAIVQGFGMSPGHVVANAHTLFNLIAAFVFLVFFNWFVGIVERIQPAKKEELVFETKYITEEPPKDSATAISLSEKEIQNLAKTTTELFSSVRLILVEEKNEIKHAKKLEEYSDFLNKKISQYLFNVSKRKLSRYEAEELSYQIRLSNSYEQLADTVMNFIEIAEYMKETGLSLSPTSKYYLNILLDRMDGMVGLLNEKRKFSEKGMKKIRKNADEIEKYISKYYRENVREIAKEFEGLHMGAIFTEILANVEACSEKITAVAEILHSRKKKEL
ncbi:MAG: Na/Pi symporter [Candidatus Anstonellales archaeon]